VLPSHVDLRYSGDLADFPFISGFCPESGAFRLSILIGECQGCQRTGLGKGAETDVRISEASCGPDRQVPFCPVITCCDENVEIAAVGAAVGGALKLSTEMEFSVSGPTVSIPGAVLTPGVRIPLS
jgi:hypothetical protein